MTFQLFQNVAADVIFYLFILFHFSKKIIKKKHLKKAKEKQKQQQQQQQQYGVYYILSFKGKQIS